jgi:dCTP deaminase
MILSDRDIKKIIKEKKLVFLPELEPDQIGPASIDLKLSPEFKVFHTTKLSVLDPKKGLPKEFMLIDKRRDEEYFILHSGEFVLAGTKEYIKVPDDMVLRVEGKSTLARMGILVHTAGFVDPGF